MKPVTSTSRGRWVRVRCHSDQGITGQRFPAAVYRRSQMAETIYGRAIFWRGANEEQEVEKGIRPKQHPHKEVAGGVVDGWRRLATGGSATCRSPEALRHRFSYL